MAKQMWREASLEEIDFFIDDIANDDVTIIIPTLNEEQAIAYVINEIRSQGFEKILVVDGDSIDKTVQIAENLNVEVVSQKGKGKTGALKTAIKRVDSPFMVVIDGDHTYVARDIDTILEYLKYYDQVIGARTNGRDNIKALNRFGNWAINKTFNLFFGTEMTDVCSGLYGLRRSFAEKMHLDTEGFDVEVEIAAQASMNGRIIEVPISYRERLGVQKLQPLRDGYQIMKTLMFLGFNYSPVIFCSTLLSCLAFPATLLLLYTAIEWFGGTWHDGLALLGILMSLIGFQSLVLSIFSVQQRRTVQEVAKRITKLRFFKKSEYDERSGYEYRND
jgi:dolichol-phosphate mannosyltransferase